MRPEATDEERDAPWLALAESPPRTTPTSLVAVLPAERLPLQLYLDSVTSGLSVEGTVVHESELRAVASWRRGDPVDPLRHARAGVSGWQVAFFDDSGAQLFVFTIHRIHEPFRRVCHDFERVIVEAET
ncbi:MAG: hypothetical protein R2873_14100 [Caldilineaceae bacterium]